MSGKNFQTSYITDMVTPRTTSYVTQQQLQVLAAQLAEWSDRLKQAADVAGQQEPTGLAIYNWPSVSKGVQLLGSFVEKAEQSRMQAELGQPLEVGQPRPRSLKSVAEESTPYRQTK